MFRMSDFTKDKDLGDDFKEQELSVKMKYKEYKNIQHYFYHAKNC